MRYLEGQRLPEPLASDVAVIELALETGWPPDVIRALDWRDLQLLQVAQEARTKAKWEMQRRAEQRAAHKAAR